MKPWTEWVLLCMYNPDEGEPDTSEEAVIARARTTIGDDSIDELDHARFWTNIVTWASAGHAAAPSAIAARMPMIRMASTPPMRPDHDLATRRSTSTGRAPAPARTSTRGCGR